MRIAFLGQKGIPATQGGVERHVEELGAALVERGHAVTVYTRPRYADRHAGWHRGMRLVSLPTIPTKHLDAIVHVALATVYSDPADHDVLHFHAIGPSLLAPLARLRHRGVIVATIHRQDYRAEKWGPVARSALRVGERVALTAPHATLCVSATLTETYHRLGHRHVVHVPNGVAVGPGCADELNRQGLEPGGYVLFVGRLVPEKGAHLLLRAFARIRPAGLELVLAGAPSHTAKYADALRAQAPGSARFLGERSREQIDALYRGAALVVLPSTVEGQPITLLEAGAHCAPALASDLPENREVLGDHGRYFRAGDATSLAVVLKECLEDLPGCRAAAARLRGPLLERHEWGAIARRTEAIYEAASARA